MSLLGPSTDYTAWKAAEEAKVKDLLITKLKEVYALSDKQMHEFKSEMVQNITEVGENRRNRPIRNNPRRQREIEEKFNGMNMYSFIDAIEKYIITHAPNDRCIRIYEDIMSVLPNPQKGRAASGPTPHDNPQTPFSISRSAPESVKSNAELIDALASAANLEPWGTIGICGQIAWRDSMDNDSTSGMLKLGSGRIRNGRLGRDHTLSDVPNQFVRDCLMDYIDTMLEEDQRENAKKAVFSDLGADEIDQYSALIKQKRERDEREAMGPTPEEREAAVKRILGTRTVKSDSEKNRVMYQADLLLGINELVDLTPKPRSGFRDDYPEPIFYSVVKPGLKRPLRSELHLNVGTDIDRNCDQLRAMISRFTRESEWTVDEFRQALGGISRQQLNTFLEKKGPAEGKASTVFPLAWEFFKKREMLGLPVPGISDDGGILCERDVNSSKKRPSTGGERDGTDGKRTREA